MTRDTEFDPAVGWLAVRDDEPAGCALHRAGGGLEDLAGRSCEGGLSEATVRCGLVEFARRGGGRVGLKAAGWSARDAEPLDGRLGVATQWREAVWAPSL